MKQKIEKLLLRLGGARLDAIEEVPHEGLLYRILGVLLFATALIATATTAHAADLYLHDWRASICVGLVLGSFILLVDAAMVQLLKRQDTWWKTVLSAVPRYAVSLVLGLAIAVPGVTSAFNNPISVEAQKIKDEKLAGGMEGIEAASVEIEELKGERDALVAEATQINLGASLSRSPQHRIQTRKVNSLRKQAAAAYARANCERDGNCGSGKVGSGPSFKAKQAQADAIRADYEAARAELASIDQRLLGEEKTAGAITSRHAQSELGPVRARITELSNRRDEQETALYSAYDKPLDPLDRLGGLMGLIENDSRMRVALLFVFLVILTLDTAPVNIKISSLLGKESDYELVMEGRRKSLTSDLARQDARRIAETAAEAKTIKVRRARQEKIRAEEEKRLEEKYRAEIRRILDQGFDTWKQTELRGALGKAAGRRTSAQPPQSTTFPGR